MDAVQKAIIQYAGRNGTLYRGGTYQEYDSIKNNGNVYILRELTQNINAVTSSTLGNAYDIYTYTEGCTETYASQLIAIGHLDSIPGSARPYK